PSSGSSWRWTWWRSSWCPTRPTPSCAGSWTRTRTTTWSSTSATCWPRTRRPRRRPERSWSRGTSGRRWPSGTRSTPRARTRAATSASTPGGRPSSSSRRPSSPSPARATARARPAAPASRRSPSRSRPSTASTSSRWSGCGCRRSTTSCGPSWSRRSRTGASRPSSAGSRSRSKRRRGPSTRASAAGTPRTARSCSASPPPGRPRPPPPAPSPDATPMNRVVLVASSPRLPLLFPPQTWRALDAARPVWVLDDTHPSLPALEVAEIPWQVLAPAGDTGPAGRDLLLVGQGMDMEAVALARRQADALLDHAARDGSATLLLPPVNDGPLVQLVADPAARSHGEVEAVYPVGEPKGAALLDLVATETRLRGPGGCPWDREQTHASLARHLVEEAYEVLDAIEEGDPEHLREELGDLL